MNKSGEKMGCDYLVKTMIEMTFRDDDGTMATESHEWKSKGAFFDEESDGDDADTCRTSRTRQMRRTVKPQVILYRHGAYACPYYKDKYGAFVSGHGAGRALLSAHKYKVAVEQA